jgi:hypothetical protein
MHLIIPPKSTKSRFDAAEKVLRPSCVIKAPSASLPARLSRLWLFATSEIPNPLSEMVVQRQPAELTHARLAASQD